MSIIVPNYLFYFFYKNIFISAKALIFAKTLRTSSEQSYGCCLTEHKNKVFRPAILELIKTKHQNTAWLLLIFYFIYTSSTVTPNHSEAY